MATKTNNIIEVKLPDTSEVLISNDIYVYQYDKGQILRFSNVENGNYVEFGNKNHDKTEPYLIENNQVEIPDIFLEENVPVVAYVRIVNENSETTIKAVVINVKKKGEVDTGIAPENQQTFIEQITEIMNTTESVAQSVRDDADNGVFDGEDGESAYQIAVDNGFVGTEEEWLESLNGKDGVDGKDGKDGKDGEDGQPGTTVYSELSDKPSVNGTTLSGNKTSEQLGLGSKIEVDELNKSVYAKGEAKNYVNRGLGYKIADNQYGTEQDANHGIQVYNNEKMYIQTPYGYQIRSGQSGSTAIETIFGAFEGVVNVGTGEYIAIDVDIDDIDNPHAFEVDDNVEKNQDDIEDLQENKQDKLTAGENITIEDGTISAQDSEAATKQLSKLNDSVYSHDNSATYVTRVSGTKIADNQWGSLSDENHGIIIYELEEAMYIQTPYGYQIRTEQSGSTAVKTVFGEFNGIVYNDISTGNYIVIDVDIEDIAEIKAYKITDNIAELQDNVEDIEELAEDTNTRVNSFARKCGKQLFDYRNVEYYDGYFTNTNGLQNDSHMKTAIIPINVTDETAVTVHRGIISSRFVIGSCNVANPIKNTPLQYEQHDNSAESLTVTVNSSTKSILVFAYNSNYDTEHTAAEIFAQIMVQFGSSYTGYEAYKEILAIDNENLEDESVTEDKCDDELKEKINTVLSEKKINCLGDSFTDDLLSYEFIFRERIPGITTVHVAKGGSAIVKDITWSASLHSPSFLSRIDGTAPNYDADPSGNTKFRGLDSTADITVVFGGINDCYLLGNNEITLGNIDSTHDTDTFYGGMQLLLDRIIAMIPNQKIVGVVPPSFQPNAPYTTYIGQIQNAEREIYKKYHVPYIDLAYDCFQMSDNATIMALYRKSVVSPTNYHPNSDGHHAIADLIQSKLETLIRTSNNTAAHQVDLTTIDDEMSAVSHNPVENRTIKMYIDGKLGLKQDILVEGTKITIDQDGKTINTTASKIYDAVMSNGSISYDASDYPGITETDIAIARGYNNVRIWYQIDTPDEIVYWQEIIYNNRQVYEETTAPPTTVTDLDDIYYTCQTGDIYIATITANNVTTVTVYMLKSITAGQAEKTLVWDNLTDKYTKSEIDTLLSQKENAFTVEGHLEKNNGKLINKANKVYDAVMSNNNISYDAADYPGIEENDIAIQRGHSKARIWYQVAESDTTVYWAEIDYNNNHVYDETTAPPQTVTASDTIYHITQVGDIWVAKVTQNNETTIDVYMLTDITQVQTTKTLTWSNLTSGGGSGLPSYDTTTDVGKALTVTANGLAWAEPVSDYSSLVRSIVGTYVEEVNE